MPTPSLSPLTKRTCKTVLSCLRDMDIADYDIIIEGNRFRIAVRNDMPQIHSDIADRINAA